MDTLEERVWTMGDYVDESPRVAHENLDRVDELTDPLVVCCGGRVPARIRLWHLARRSTPASAHCRSWRRAFLASRSMS